LSSSKAIGIGATAVLLALVSCLVSAIPASAGLTTSPTWHAFSATRGPLVSDPGVVIDDATCGSPTFCVAVGSYFDNQSRQMPLLMTLSSGKWSSQPVVLPGGAAPAPGASLLHVSCSSASSCAAVGTYAPAITPGWKVVLVVSGGSGLPWTVEEAPLPEFALVDQVGGISCSTDGFCTAIATYAQGERALSISGFGSTWTDSPVPVPDGATHISLSGLSCISVSECAAVGEYTDPAGEPNPLVLSETGALWSDVDVSMPASVPVGTPVSLNHITCSATGDCIAIGGVDSEWVWGNLVLTESEGQWAYSLVSAPTGAVGGTEIESIYCQSDIADCVAVGTFLNAQDDDTGQLLRESAGNWSAIAAPTPAATSKGEVMYLDSLACSSEDNCLAAEQTPTTPNHWTTSLLEDVSSVWQLDRLPMPANASTLGPNPLVGGVACPSAMSCVAVGSVTDSAFRQVPIAVTDAGGATSLAEPGLPPGQGAPPLTTLGGVSCPLPATCVAVGNLVDYPSGQTLGVIEDVLQQGRWTVTETPLPATWVSVYTSITVADLSCLPVPLSASGITCSAVGWAELPASQTVKVPITLTFSGGHWTLSELPVVGGIGTGGESLSNEAVSCATASHCVVIAGTEIAVGAGPAWSATTAQAPPGGNGTIPSAVSCPSSGGGCTVVGIYRQVSNEYFEPTALTQVGSRWVPSSLPAPGGSVYGLPAVDCTSTTSCAAVGYDARTTDWGLVLVEGAKGWTAAAAAPVLVDVSCASATVCLALGRYETWGAGGVVVTDNRGILTTKAVPSPTSALGGEDLAHIACATSVPTCVADGTAYAAVKSQTTVPALLAGVSGSWTAIAAPAPSGDASVSVSKVACSSKGLCMAIGSFTNPHISAYASTGLIDVYAG
jgi:hypothetical protein